MRSLIRHPVSLVWLGLMLATALSWWLGADPDSSADPKQLTTVLIAVALIKVRFVMRYFMEVREAIRPLALLADAWVLVVFIAIVGQYWYLS